MVDRNAKLVSVLLFGRGNYFERYTRQFDPERFPDVLSHHRIRVLVINTPSDGRYTTSGVVLNRGNRNGFYYSDRLER